MDAQSFIDYMERIPFDERDPDPFLAVFLDRSMKIEPAAKAALLKSIRSKIRQFVMPVVRPLARFVIVLNQLVKILIPNAFTSSKFLHHSIYHGLRLFVSPEANFLILRHFSLGSEILSFVRDNSGVREMPSKVLKPTNLADIKNDLFLVHDLNLFNFVINLNRELNKEDRDLSVPARLNLDAITDGPVPLDPLPSKWHNLLDLETAIEIYTPMYQLLLTDHDFWRATNSLQLDETIGIYCAKILGDESKLWMVNNRHPLVPLTTLRAGHRLLLHGLSTELLHYHLRLAKRMQNAARAQTVGRSAEQKT
jgi:hypothetical protein